MVLLAPLRIQRSSDKFVQMLLRVECRISLPGQSGVGQLYGTGAVRME